MVQQTQTLSWRHGPIGSLFINSSAVATTVFHDRKNGELGNSTNLVHMWSFPKWRNTATHFFTKWQSMLAMFQSICTRSSVTTRETQRKTLLLNTKEWLHRAKHVFLCFQHFKLEKRYQFHLWVFKVCTWITKLKKHGKVKKNVLLAERINGKRGCFKHYFFVSVLLSGR